MEVGETSLEFVDFVCVLIRVRVGQFNSSPNPFSYPEVSDCLTPHIVLTLEPPSTIGLLFMLKLPVRRVRKGFRFTYVQRDLTQFTSVTKNKKCRPRAYDKLCNGNSVSNCHNL